jgi:Outer membrane protein beta-barrel domain
MKNKITLSILLVLCSLTAFSQNGQFSIEGGYGTGISSKSSSVSSNGHFEAGVRYMFNEHIGLKGDFAQDEFTTKSGVETGSTYQRVSLQAVYNIGRDLYFPDYTDGLLNTLIHAGAGLSRIESTEIEKADRIGNLIIGITPQLFITRNITLHTDISYVVNIRQHYDFDGYRHYKDDTSKAFVGGLFNASVGLTIYLGRNASDNDWR